MTDLGQSEATDERPGLAVKQCSGPAWTHCARICDYCLNPPPMCADCGLREPSWGSRRTASYV